MKKLGYSRGQRNFVVSRWRCRSMLNAFDSSIILHFFRVNILRGRSKRSSARNVSEGQFLDLPRPSLRRFTGLVIHCGDLFWSLADFRFNVHSRVAWIGHENAHFFRLKYNLQDIRCKLIEHLKRTLIFISGLSSAPIKMFVPDLEQSSNCHWRFLEMEKLFFPDAMDPRVPWNLHVAVFLVADSACVAWEKRLAKLLRALGSPLIFLVFRFFWNNYANQSERLQHAFNVVIKTNEQRLIRETVSSQMSKLSDRYRKREEKKTHVERWAIKHRGKESAVRHRSFGFRARCSRSKSQLLATLFARTIFRTLNLTDRRFRRCVDSRGRKFTASLGLGEEASGVSVAARLRCLMSSNLPIPFLLSPEAGKATVTRVFSDFDTRTGGVFDGEHEDEDKDEWGEKDGDVELAFFSSLLSTS